jgi:hypothetical protein
MSSRENNVADDEKMKGKRKGAFCSMWTIKFDMMKSSIRIGLAFGCYSCSINIWLQSSFSLSFSLISFIHVIPFWWLTIHSQIQQFQHNNVNQQNRSAAFTPKTSLYSIEIYFFFFHFNFLSLIILLLWIVKYHEWVTWYGRK